MEKAKVDAMAEFRISQPFFDACGLYYDDTVPPTRGGEDTVNDETVDSTHTVEQEVETDNMVITQPIPGGPNGLPAENPTTADDLPTVNPTVLDALPS
nr:hypothetical protein CFP56_60150 [Quercus suber]